MSECNSVNIVVLTYIGALVGFLSKIVTSVHRYEQDKAFRHILLNLFR
jgi:hypothetical protein